MGCDIHGYIEVKPYAKLDPEYWDSVVNIGHIVGRNYDMFGLLFGQRNYSNYEPIAEGRGLPKYAKHQRLTEDEDNRTQTQKDSKGWGSDGHSHSWITWSEIEKIDWEKETDDLDDRIHEYIVKDGKEEYFGKASMYGYLTEKEKQDLVELKTVEKSQNGMTRRYRLEKVKLKDAISGDWKVLFDIMKRLAEQHSNGDHVRLVVWFDN